MNYSQRDTRHDFREWEHCGWCGAPLPSSVAVYLTLSGPYDVARRPYCHRTCAIRHARQSLDAETFAQQENK